MTTAATEVRSYAAHRARRHTDDEAPDVRIPAWVFAMHEDVPARALGLYVWMIGVQQITGRAPAVSWDTMCRATGLSAIQLAGALGTLADMGLVQVERQTGSHPNVYRLPDVADLEQKKEEPVDLDW